jgi:hypothetical protein
VRIYPIQAIFTRGELTPLLHSRVDLEYFKMSYKYAENFILARHGGLMNRPGTKFLGEVRDHNKKARLVKFRFSRTQVYVLEFGDLYVRFWAVDGHVTSASNSITGITQANPGVLTYSGADNFANGDKVFISGVLGMTQVNGIEVEVANVNTAANTFELLGLNTTTFDAYTSGGTVSKIYKVTTTYTEAEVPELQFAQSNDVIYIAHKSHAPAKLQRFTETNWTLSDVVFVDGPYLPVPAEGRANLTLSGSGEINVTSGMVSSDGGTNVSDIFDGQEFDAGEVSGQQGTITIDLGVGVTRVCNNYIFVLDETTAVSNAPKVWKIRGSNNGSSYTDLDSRVDEVGWQLAEARYYEFHNVTAYRFYQIQFLNNNGGANIVFGEIYMGQNGDFATTLTLTASSLVGINGGIGFQSTDVGRTIRLFATNDARWRWFKITSFVSTTQVIGRLYGFPFREGRVITEFQMGAFSVESGWPGSVSFFGGRLVWGRTNTKPLGLYLSKVESYEDYGVSDPIVDDDGMTLNITSKETEEILWLAEGVVDLVIGTSVSIRTLERGDGAQALSPTNYQINKQIAVGTGPLQPQVVGSAILYPSYHLKSLREFVYNYEINGYTAPEVSILSDHLLKPKIVYSDYANDPEPILWISNGNGELIGLTYDRDNKVVGMHRQRIAGSITETFGVVESVCIIPGDGQDDLWMIIKRVMSGVTKRYVERMTLYFDDTVTKENAWFLDSALLYEGAAVGTFAGLNHLNGQIVSVYANNTTYEGLTVTLGKVTLPDAATATKALIGRPYSPYVDLLAPSGQVPDGVNVNRKKHSVQAIMDLYRTKGLKVGTSRTQEQIMYRENGLLTATPTELYTGVVKPKYDSRWDDGAEIRILQDKPYPCFIRSVMLTHEGEP